jgi:hypothetical protein
VTPSVNYDHREAAAAKNAAGASLSKYLSRAETAFLEDVLAATGKFDGDGIPVEYKVVGGANSPFLSFKGFDPSDISIDGYMSLIVTDYDVRVIFSMQHGMLGKKEDELRTKTGMLTPELAAKRLAEFMFGRHP